MNFDDLKVSAELIKVGMQDILTDIDNEEISELYRTLALTNIKQDLKIELNQSDIDFNAYNAIYEYLFVECLKLMQQLLILENNVNNIGYAEEFRKSLTTKYDNLKKKFSGLKLTEKVSINNCQIVSQYL
jgi:hypothetical protein